MTLSVGFTGTSRGLTPFQVGALKVLFSFATLTESERCELHHGDCIGADARAHELARVLRWLIIIHPPEDAGYRAFCQADAEQPLKPYLVRNHDIVDACNILIACPALDHEVQRSGTWATIRYARKVARPHVIVWPSGEMEVV